MLCREYANTSNATGSIEHQESCDVCTPGVMAELRTSCPRPPEYHAACVTVMDQNDNTSVMRVSHGVRHDRLEICTGIQCSGAVMFKEQ